MTGNGATAIDVVDLVKRYPRADANAVDGVSFAVPRGEIFGLLGPNGAGKSTTVGILTTRLRATSGRAVLGGVDVLRDPVAARAQLAVVPQHNNLDRSLTPRQNLLFHAAYHGVDRATRRDRATELLDRFGLADGADKRIESYSGGMAQRLMIARALIHEPAVLFLDEPTNALDPQTRMLIWARVRQMRERGVTVVLTTHQMNAAAGVVDRVGVVDRGRLLALDTPANLIRRLAGAAILDLTITPAPADAEPGLLGALLEISGVRKGESLAPAAPAPGLTRPGLGAALAARAGFGAGLGAGGFAAGGLGPGGPGGLAAAALARREQAAAGSSPNGRKRLRFRLHVAGDPATLLAPALAVLTTRSATLNDVRIVEPSLEDVFIELTGRDPR